MSRAAATGSIAKGFTDRGRNAALVRARPVRVSFAELCATTNFSFLRGASAPRGNGRARGELGLAGLGVADRNTLAGVVRAYAVAQTKEDFNLIVGARLVFRDGTPDIICLPDATAPPMAGCANS